MIPKDIAGICDASDARLFSAKLSCSEGFAAYTHPPSHQSRLSVSLALNGNYPLGTRSLTSRQIRKGRGAMPTIRPTDITFGRDDLVAGQLTVTYDAITSIRFEYK